MRDIADDNEQMKFVSSQDHKDQRDLETALLRRALYVVLALVATLVATVVAANLSAHLPG